MPELRGIPGIKKGVVKCELVRSITAVMRTVKPGLAAGAAGENGAIGVWMGDDGDYRCNFCRRLQVLSQGSFAQKSKLRAWLREWWPQMGDRNKEARRF